MYPDYINKLKGKKLVIATMHGKDTVIAPVLKQNLNVTPIVPDKFNTDSYGTFSGEIERIDDPITAARRKCLDACKLTNATSAVASEGSFGPHPTMFFVPADDEFMIFVDTENGIEIVARELSLNTNFAGGSFTEWQEIEKFAGRIGFPAHKLIARKEKADNSDLVKDISSAESLKTNFEYFLGKYGTIFLETDMRAMSNPTRMAVIESVANKLVKKILNPCPNCNFPGFDVTDVVEGLPCSLCGSPTRSTLYHEYQCKKCGHKNKVMYPNGVQKEDPTYCDYCNP